eukprot:7039716-Prymnesium_polylepis.1
MGHYAWLEARSKAQATTLHVEKRSAELAEKKQADQEVECRLLTDKLRSLDHLHSEKREKAQLIEQDIQAGERMAMLLETHAIVDQPAASFRGDGTRREAAHQAKMDLTAQHVWLVRAQHEGASQRAIEALRRLPELEAYKGALATLVALVER